MSNVDHELASAERGERILGDLRRLSRAIKVQSKSMSKTTGLSSSQLAVLRACSRLGEANSRQLSEEVRLSPGTVAVVLDRLEEKGLVERCRSKVDRRIVHTRLSREGAAALNASAPTEWRWFIEQFSLLPKERQDQIVDAVNDLANVVDPPRTVTVELAENVLPVEK